jgi:uncharacterized membrane protein YfcA
MTLITCALLSAAVFGGAFVAGLAGFAFSAVAGAILLQIFEPIEAVPLMMACSVGVQATNLWALRHSIEWRHSLAMMAGGIFGIPISIYLLHAVDTRTFREGFGVVVALYSGYMLFRPSLSCLSQMESRTRNALIGFGGGLVGGLTAMPGAIPTIWCDMHGLPKSRQRGVVQPFIATMQVCALALMFARHDLSSSVLIDFAIGLPALIMGSLLGILAYRYIDETNFRRIILGILFFSGVSLIL